MIQRHAAGNPRDDLLVIRRFRFRFEERFRNFQNRLNARGGKGDVAGEEGHSNVTATSNGGVIINYNTANADLVGLYGGANINGLVSGNIAVNVLANVGAAAVGTPGDLDYVAEQRIDIFGGGYGANTNTGGNVP